jgi:hypothetical protein
VLGLNIWNAEVNIKTKLIIIGLAELSLLEKVLGRKVESVLLFEHVVVLDKLIGLRKSLADRWGFDFLFLWKMLFWQAFL